MMLFLIGVLAWSLFEYVLHIGSHFIYEAVHLEGHHRYPHDYNLGPPSWTFVAVFAAVMWGVCFPLGWLTFAAGFSVGYTFFAVVHFLSHFRNGYWLFKLARPLWRNHNVHHYLDTGKNFGVSSPLWDFVFRTYKG